MFSLPWKFILAGVAALAVLVTVVVHFNNDAKTRADLDKLQTEAGVVLEVTREAADNPELEWESVPGQVRALGDSVDSLRVAITTQNARIDEMAAEAVRLRARADELRAIADRAEAQRASALRRLSDMEITPGTRDDSMQLLKEAEEALDIVRSAGL